MLVEDDKLVLEDSSTIGTTDMRLPRRSAIFDIDQPGLVTDAARSGRPVLVNDVLGDPRFTTVPELANTRSELVVPIEVKGNIIGVLDVHSNRPSAYDQTDVLLLQSLASQAGVAIENARLFTDAERTAWREHAAREIIARVQTATDVEQILQIAVRGLGQALSAPRSTVQLGVQEAPDADPGRRGSTTTGPDR
jgi:GAF domain-containing protein